jgi:hypothetical protein
MSLERGFEIVRDAATAPARKAQEDFSAALEASLGQE